MKSLTQSPDAERETAAKALCVTGRLAGTSAAASPVGTQHLTSAPRDNLGEGATLIGTLEIAAVSSEDFGFSYKPSYSM